MSDKVKLIIEIPKAEYERLVYIDHLKLRGYIENGIPLDDVKEEIEQDMSFDMFDDYGNKTRIHKELWEILDNIDKESEGADD
jgi:hypothetical protein